jgi:single-strand DNA-binding protein
MGGSNLNSVLLEGNLTRDVLLKTTHNGSQVINFSIAVNRYYKPKNSDTFVKEVSYFDIESWFKFDQLDKLTKGQGVRVVGRLRQDRWEDSDKKMQSKVKIVAETIELRKMMYNNDPTVQMKMPIEETPVANQSDNYDDIPF